MPKQVKWHLPEEVEEASSVENPVTKFLKVRLFQRLSSKFYMRFFGFLFLWGFLVFRHVTLNTLPWTCNRGIILP